MVDNACSVTVVGSRRRVDVALPAGLPVAEFVWDLVGLLEEPDGEPGAQQWALVRIGGRELDAELGLGAQGVVDGALLFLRDLSRPPAPLVVDDYAEAVALAVEARGGRWGPAAREAVLMLAALAWLALGAGAAFRVPDLAIRAAATLAAALVLLLSGVLVSRRLGRPGPGALLALGALLYWVAGGLATGQLLRLPPLATYAAAAGSVCAGAVLALMAGGRTRERAGLVLNALALPALLVALSALLGGNLLQAAAAMAPLALVQVRFLPRLAVRLSGLGEERSLSQTALPARVEAGHDLLGAMVIGAAAAISGACLLLAYDGGWYALGLLAAVAVGAATQVRHFRFTAEAAPLAAAALIALLALELALLRRLLPDAALAAALVVAAPASALVLVAVGLLSRRVRLTPRLGRRLQQLEGLALFLSFPLAAGAAGAYSAVAELGHRLG